MKKKKLSTTIRRLVRLDLIEIRHNSYLNNFFALSAIKKKEKRKRERERKKNINSCSENLRVFPAEAIQLSSDTILFFFSFLSLSLAHPPSTILAQLPQERERERERE
uniref:Uncharacterized protein n=1 Tax=Bracon brevicornis TaxID=1563983 RepID=A0A6V7L6P5_9HYME